MDSGWRYRLLAFTGVVAFTGTSVILVNNGLVQLVASSAPVLSRLSADPPGTAEFTLEVLTTVAVFVAAFFPLYRPRPRRLLDTASLAGRRVVFGVLMLATIGYFDYTYRLPRLTLILLTPLLLSALPTWFVWIRQRPNGDSGRTLIVGNDSKEIKEIAREIDVPLVGYLCSTSPFQTAADVPQLAVADGGTIANLERLGGLSRIEDVLVNYDIDTVVLAFTEADRAEFFGALDACYEYGVDAKAHPQHADSVLTSGSTGSLVDVVIEPWDMEDYVIKRIFDITFAVIGLVILSPIILVIAAAIKLDDGGFVFYSQERTAVFGETFNVYKFRTMVENAEKQTGATISDEDAGDIDPRVTSVGRILRKTHLDEIPQLWSVLKGDMSVVGPRPERPELDVDIQSGVDNWQKRWFVKPGLTGLAQVNNVTGAEPGEKIRYDLAYVRKQSFRFDVKLVVRQIWKMLEDVVAMVR
ncbi:sugar transferase [Halospeciosus flavus]|uniref:Sugar transferase n=1 Tax=Halospeciosus flavus TaxID=3032283 RepID=A0ABD5Z6D6_9EURY|nr:sugar transferase [Halospeciosus flavus]